MMQFHLTKEACLNSRADAVIVGIYESGEFSLSAKQINNQTQGLIQKLIDRKDITGKNKTVLTLYEVANLARVILVGLGKKEQLNPEKLRLALEAGVKSLKKTQVTAIDCFLLEELPSTIDTISLISQLVRVVGDVTHQIKSLKKETEQATTPQNFSFYISTNQEKYAQTGLKQGMAIVKGMDLMKDLADTAPNICTASYLAKTAQALAKEYGLDIEILEKADMRTLGMGALLGVSQGSYQDPKLIVLKYQGGKADEKPFVIVGKGITFDTGGISIKPAGDMDHMKYDMSGAASVLGTIKSVAELHLPINVIGIAPCCENMPDGNAIRPGDILTSMSGQTIEVLNTDAEGRLILCDALTYVERFDPCAVIDVATLTGACVVALGHHPSGMYSNQEELAKALLKAGHFVFDRVWQLPLWEDYQSDLDSNFADMANVGGRAGGSITAACFLARFTQKYHWAHLDIAGTAWKSGKDKSSTGRPVPLLVQFLVDSV